MKVYNPGLSVTTIADSRSLVGGMPVAIISASWVSLQLSFMIVVKPAGPCSSITGSASAPVTVKEGPMARRMTRLGSLPVMMKPPMPTSAPVWTSIRVERLSAWADGGVGVGEAVGVAVAVPVGPGVGVGGTDAEAVGVGLGMPDV